MSKSLFILMGYFALTFLVLLATVGLVAYGQGYSYDFSNRRLTHNGLVLISTNPSGATVRVQSKFGTKKTPYHSSFEEGSYRFTVSKKDYEPWTKVLKVIASQVTLAQYIVLIPTNHPSTVLDRRIQMSAQTISRDHRHMAYLVPGTNGGLYTLDLTAGRPATRTYAPVIATDPAQQEVLTDVSWSDDATHLLLGSTISGVHTVRLIAASDGSQINLTDKFHFDFTTLQFSGRDWRQLYWLSTDGIRRLDVGSQTVTGILADKVSQFAIAGDRVLFVQTNDLGQSLGSLDARDHKTTVIQALVKSPSYAIKYESFRGQDIIAVVPSSTQTGTLYTNVFSSDVTAKVVASNVSNILFSDDGHLATFYSATQINNYDLEQSGLLAKSVSYNFGYPTSMAITGISYYDGYHLLLNQNGHLHFVEFDGENDINLGPIAVNTTAFRLADQKAIVAGDTLPDSTALKSISIK